MESARYRTEAPKIRIKDAADAYAGSFFIFRILLKELLVFEPS